jgi:hypothetical protein
MRNHSCSGPAAISKVLLRPGTRPEARVKWARQLSDEEAKAYTTENVLRGADGWNPNVK